MLFQTSIAKRLTTPTRPLSAGAVHCSRVTFTFNAAYATATDQIELAVLPAFATIVDAVLIGEAVDAVTADVGIMSGEVGDAISVRTVGDELFDAAQIDADTTRMSNPEGFTIPSADYDRSIGAVVSGNVAASAAKKLTLLVFYQM